MIRKRYEDWILVEDKLPLEEYTNEKCNIMGEFLVTVELEVDEIFDSEVMILTFWKKESIWKTTKGEEYNWGWKVTHWMDKPLPAKNKP